MNTLIKSFLVSAIIFMSCFTANVFAQNFDIKTGIGLDLQYEAPGGRQYARFSGFVDGEVRLARWFSYGAELGLVTPAPDSRMVTVRDGNSSYTTTEYVEKTAPLAYFVPKFDFYLVRKEKVQVYGNLGLGISYDTERMQKYPLRYEFMFTPIGVKLGGKRVQGFSEIVVSSLFVGYRAGISLSF